MNGILNIWSLFVHTIVDNDHMNTAIRILCLNDDVIKKTDHMIGRHDNVIWKDVLRWSSWSWDQTIDQMLMYVKSKWWSGSIKVDHMIKTMINETLWIPLSFFDHDLYIITLVHMNKYTLKIIWSPFWSMVWKSLISAFFCGSYDQKMIIRCCVITICDHDQ